MPSARDLLEQADALMRANRNVGASDSDRAVPVLTDIAEPAGFGISQVQHHNEIPVLTNPVTTMPVSAAKAPGQGSLPAPLSAAATLRDSTMFPISQMPHPTTDQPAPTEQESEPIFSVTAMRAQLADATNWDAGLIEPPTVQPSLPPIPEIRRVSSVSAVSPIPGFPLIYPAPPIHPVPAVSTVPLVATVSPVAPVSTFPLVTPVSTVSLVTPVSTVPLVAPATIPLVPAVALVSTVAPILPVLAVPAVPPVHVEAAPSAAEIAENVYYQVLQNLDLYTERALQEHLTTHLSPILERASSELLATLHANLGGLIRQYVADAIEKQLGVRPDSSP